MKEFFKKYKIDLIIFSIALVARLFVFFINLNASHGNLEGTIHGDDGYYELSRGLVEGHGFEGYLAPFIPNTLRTPLYIYFIAGVLMLTHSYWAVIILQMIMGSVIPILGRHLALKLVSSKKIALWVGILLSFQPYLIVFSSIFYTETFFIFLFMIFILVFLKYIETGSSRTLVWSSFVLGMATLTKTTVQYLPILLVLIIIWNFRKAFLKEKILFHCFIFIFVFISSISPWLYRNYVEFGVIGMSAQPAYNAYVYLVPTVLSLENGTSFSEELRKFVAPEISSGNVINLSNSSLYTKKAFNVLKKHPEGIVKSVAITIITFFTHDGMLTFLQHAGYVPDVYMSKSVLSMALSAPTDLIRAIIKYIQSPLVLVFIMRIFWIVVTIAFLIGFYRFIRSSYKDAVTMFIFSIVLYFVLTSAIGGLGVNARYRMPIEPIIFTFALTGLVFVRNAILAKHAKG